MGASLYVSIAVPSFYKLTFRTFEANRLAFENLFEMKRTGLGVTNGKSIVRELNLHGDYLVENR
jgi:hypothetical protein